DLARLLVALTARGSQRRVIIEPDDGTPGGWSHKDFAKALGQAVGRRTVTLSTPRPLMRLGARLDQLFRRDRAKLTPDRAAYFSHPDWVVTSGRFPPPELWHPRIEIHQGLAATARWYREHGWL
ncbi:MAG: NAD(P)-dependent oxidoreductase, partial [Sphingomicrobium sp.]